MRHVENALNKMRSSNKNFISITNKEDIKGVCPIVSFKFQSDPISEVGLNGLQHVELIEFVKCLIESLNEKIACRENDITIYKLEEAIHWQEARTRNRENRGVEGENKA